MSAAAAGPAKSLLTGRPSEVLIELNVELVSRVGLHDPDP